MGSRAAKAWLTNAVAAAFSALHLYQATFGFFEAHISRGIYILGSLLLAFLTHPLLKSTRNAATEVADACLALLVCWSVGTYMIQFPSYADAAGLPLAPYDMAAGIVTVLLVLEACRRAIGWALTALGIVFLFYLHLGNLLPAQVGHRGFDLNRIISVLYASTDGIFGPVAYVFSTFIFLFIIFGTFIQRSGAGRFFIELSRAVVGRFTGGAAQTAVTSSWLLGSIIGSSTANTAITGAVTIPLMMSAGYRPHVAAAVEAVVSIGGQFMPPIMGAGAFLMAALVGVPYLQVAVAGLLPALLFFCAMIFMVYLEARRLGIEPIPRAQLPRVGAVLRSGWYYFVPIGVVVYVLAKGYSPSMAGVWAVVSVLAATSIRREDRMGPRAIVETLALAGKDSLVMAVTAGVVGIIVIAIAMPGLGMKFSGLVLGLSGGSLPLALLLVMAASFVLGMGMNVTSAYLLLVTLSAPAMLGMGLPLLTAHFFVFWTSQLAVITPPVCLSAYVAAGIAKADPWKTGWYSLRMGLPIYYIPFLFVYNPFLLGAGAPWQIAWSFGTALVGVLCFSAVCQGFLVTETRLLDRALLVGAAYSLVTFGLVSDLVGAGLLGIVLAAQWFRRRHLVPAKP